MDISARGVKGEPAARQPRAGAVPPRVAEGVELIGEYEDSGFKTPPSIARRADGQVIQLSRLLYLVANACDGRRGFDEIAQEVSREFGRGVSAENVRFLAESKLRPLGVLALPDGSTPKARRADPMLALKYRAAVVPEGAVNAVTTIFRPLFWPVVIVAVLGALVAFDVWVFAYHGVAQAFRQLLYDPILMLLLLGLIILSAGFHEIGHATACRYGGARPGVLGAGIYIVWPAFYSDVTDAYRLNKWGRLRTDLGGVYFNSIFILATAAAYFTTHYEVLLAIVVIQHLEIIHQFLPFLRLDGYYVIADLTGVPDIFSRIKPVLRSVVPGRPADKRVTELKGWVRAVVTLWVLAMIPIVVYIYGVLVISLPRLLSTAWDSGLKQVGSMTAAASHGQPLLVILAVIQLVALSLPVAGLLLSLTGLVRRLEVAGWKKTAGRPALRGGFVLANVVLGGLLLLAWTPPRAVYHPIRPTDRGTVAGANESWSNYIVLTRAALPGATAVAQPGVTASPAAGASPATDASPAASPSASTGSGTGAGTGTGGGTSTPTASPEVSPSP